VILVHKSVQVKEILIGYAHFEQGYLHKDYIYHLYDIFKSYCNSEPKTSNRLADKRTGAIYTRIQFVTVSLPCFNEFYACFYPGGKKKVPLNIGELLTPSIAPPRGGRLPL
jgi:hypothetical protein